MCTFILWTVFLDNFTKDQAGTSLSYFIPQLNPVNLTENGKIIESYPFSLEIKHSMPSNIKLLSFKIKKTPHLCGVMLQLLDNMEYFKERAKEVKITVPPTDEFIGGNNEIKFDHTVYFYTEDELTDSEKSILYDYLKDKDLLVQVRGPKFMALQNEKKKTHTFISHDFKDRNLIAAPLANGLIEKDCPVWFNNIEIGENILEAIERGIKESKKCILVITPNYLSNIRYAKREFEAIIAREMIKKERVILPIWYNITEEEVGDYSLSLAATFAYTWPSQEGKSPEKYQEEVNDLIVKLSDFLKKNK